MKHYKCMHKQGDFRFITTSGPVPAIIYYCSARHYRSDHPLHARKASQLPTDDSTPPTPQWVTRVSCPCVNMTKQNNNGHMIRSMHFTFFQTNQISRCMAVDVGIPYPRRTHRLGKPCIPPKTDPAEKGGDVPWLISELIVNLSIQHVYLRQISISKITKNRRKKKKCFSFRGLRPHQWPGGLPWTSQTPVIGLRSALAISPPTFRTKFMPAQIYHLSVS